MCRGRPLAMLTGGVPLAAEPSATLSASSASIALAVAGGCVTPGPRRPSVTIVHAIPPSVTPDF